MRVIDAGRNAVCAGVCNRAVRGSFRGNFAPGGRLRLPSLTGDATADGQHYVVVERAGVRFLVGNTQLRQDVKNDIRLDLQLSSQLIYSDLTHTMAPRNQPHSRGIKTIRPAPLVTTYFSSAGC
jgi:hypothetical protein